MSSGFSHAAGSLSQPCQWSAFMPQGISKGEKQWSVKTPTTLAHPDVWSKARARSLKPSINWEGMDNCFRIHCSQLLTAVLQNQSGPFTPEHRFLCAPRLLSKACSKCLFSAEGEHSIGKLGYSIITILFLTVKWKKRHRNARKCIMQWQLSLKTCWKGENRRK